MPRPLQTWGRPACLVAALCCAALGPAALHAALAAAAGTLFEAAPFVLVAEALPNRRGLRALASFAGCGCGAAIPGALSFAAIGLCWLTFGPVVALARTAGAVALLLSRRSRTVAPHPDPQDAFGELLALAPSAAAAGVFASVLASHASALSAAPAASAVAFSVGLVLGCLAPCGTAAVAIAAALAPHLPFAAAAVLTTGGLVPRFALFRCGPGGSVDGPDDGHGATTAPAQHHHKLVQTRRGTTSRAIDRCACVARIALSVALAILALGGPRGFVNPRLVPFEGLAAALALAGLRRTPGAGGAAFVVPAILLIALAAGSPEPAYLASETRLDDAFAGERLTFTGVAYRRGAVTTVQRFAITCCRVDASVIAVRTTTPLPVADRSWIRATGLLTDSPNGLLLRVKAWQPVERPADPFVYR